MRLRLDRTASDSESTLGQLFRDDAFACYTLEDQPRRGPKVKGETRIPAGTYDIRLRTEGGFHERYKRRFPDIHKGMLHLQAVPGFAYILIHCGNFDSDTEGCILVGDSYSNMGRWMIGQSEQAYRRIYPPIAAALLNGRRVEIKVEDNDL